MCWAVGSPNDAVRGHCRVCRILENRGPCPHELHVCTQRAGHPDFDVRHYVNSELRWTNHCGYCKWAKANPDAEPKQNRGWPGCCRAPGSKEWVMVKDPTVATIIARMHDVPVPDAVKHALDHAAARPAPPPPPATAASLKPASTGTGPAALAAGGKTRPSDEQPPPPAADAPARRLSVSSAAAAAAPSPPAPRRANTAPDNAAVARALLHKKSGALQLQQSAQVFSDSDSSSTVRSEFTDYLSDESEAELQRLALERAQLKREEDEFRAARARLAAVDTIPPIEWRPTQPASGTAPTRPRHGSNGSGGSAASTKQASPKPAPAPAAYVARPAPQAPAAPNPAAIPRVTTSVSEIQRAIAAQNRAAAAGIQPPRQPQAPRIRGG